LSECLELTAGLSVSLPKLNLTKLKLKIPESMISVQKRKKKKKTKILLYHKSSCFLKFSSSSSLFSDVWPKDMQ